MGKERILATVELFYGKIISQTENHFEVEYEDIPNKVSCERILSKLGVVILPGPFSDIGNKERIHRIYL